MDAQTPCERCGFRPGSWSEADAVRTLTHAADLLDGWSVAAPDRLVASLREKRADALREIRVAAGPVVGVHRLWHALAGIAAARRSAGDEVRSQRGTLAALHASGGGVPKTPVPSAEVGLRGLRGDVQRHRKHHGRPWQALCLWSLEVIEAFAAEGHPIAPGFAGENLTLSGLDWSGLRGGATLRLGSGARSVLCQLSAPAVPCGQNAGWFSDADVSRMSHALHPGQSRWYASVLRGGTLWAGDAAVLSPA